MRSYASEWQDLTCIREKELLEREYLKTLGVGRVLRALGARVFGRISHLELKLSRLLANVDGVSEVLLFMFRIYACMPWKVHALDHRVTGTHPRI